ncbi:hypothetical protein EV1_000663 [Malus domestica]
MIGFDDGDIDDEIDPALKEKIDREVEDFARRLNSDWPERMQEILSLGQERRPVPFSINGNSSFRRYACYKCFTCFSFQLAFEPNDMPCSLRPRVEGEC